MRRAPLAISRRLYSTEFPFVDRQARDVVQGDLAATLEAHRESNRRVRIRTHFARGEGGSASPQSGSRPEDRYRLGQPLLNTKGDDPLTLDRSSLPEGITRREAAQLVHAQFNPRLQDPQDAGEEWQVQDRPFTRKRKIARLNEMRAEGLRVVAQAYGSYVPPHAYRDRDRFEPYTADLLSAPIEGREKLDELIRNFERWITLTPGEIAGREHLRTAISEQLRKSVKNVTYTDFGMDRELATPLSTVDIAFSSAKEEEGLTAKRVRQIQRRKLYKMRQYTDGMLSIQNPRFTETTDIPDLHMRHKHSNANVRITAGKPSATKQSLVKGWLEEFPLLRPLYLIVRTTLDVRGLSDPVTGGLGTYTLLCMLVAFLRLSARTSHTDPGIALWEFLDFYASFNTRLHGLAIDPPSLFPKHGVHEKPSAAIRAAMADNEVLYWQYELGLANSQRPWLLTMQDPNDMANDVGAQFSRVMDVRMTFRVLATRLRKWLGAPPERQTEDPLLSFFAKMLGAVRDRRRQFLRWARLPQMAVASRDPVWEGSQRAERPAGKRIDEGWQNLRFVGAGEGMRYVSDEQREAQRLAGARNLLEPRRGEGVNSNTRLRRVVRESKDAFGESIGSRERAKDAFKGLSIER